MAPRALYTPRPACARIVVARSFFEGGGFCTDIADCRTRSVGYLGSTAADGPTVALTDPYFDLNGTLNPLLSRFNHVYVRYCDGGYYSGDRANPVPSANASANASAPPLYFRGRHISEALLADLAAKHSLGAATDVVIAGCSAGGIRTYAHIDALKALLPKAARVVGFADSGFYLDLDIFVRW